jgi:MFS transporter, putative metabolite transport protein
VYFLIAIRGEGAGSAAAFAKLGAVQIAFFFPIPFATISTQSLLYGLVGTSILGAVVT